MRSSCLDRPTRRFVIIVVAACAAGLPAGCPTQEQGDTPPDLEQRLDSDSAAVDLAREIEEADIIKEQDGFFYLANPYRGLRIIDVRNMAAPVLAGGIPLSGRGVELFVRDNRAFIFTTADYLFCGGDVVGFNQATFAGISTPEFEGTRLWVVDVTDKGNPQNIAKLDFEGYVSATRRVGDVIYVAGNLPSQDTGQQSNDVAVSSTDPAFRSGVFVTSINIADPASAALVQTERFDGSSLDIHVSDRAMYVLGVQFAQSSATLVSYIDITDPAGRIRLRDQFQVPGAVRNRFFADDFDGTVRIVTEDFSAANFDEFVALYTYDLTSPDDITMLARTPIISGESLEAVRFDGPRAYAVTFLMIDPLFVIDLSNPAAPIVAGELEVPGYSTHLVPLGDRLVGVGFDDTEGFRPAVALYDVANPAQPVQLSRIIVGKPGSYGTTSEATVDEKALKVLESAGLILLPFSSYDEQNRDYVDSLQIIGLEPRALLERGKIDHRGLVRRAGLREGFLWVLSDSAFQTVDASNLDQPAPLGRVDVITELELNTGLARCLDSARFRGREVGNDFGPVVPINPYFGPFWFCFPFGFLMLTGALVGTIITAPRQGRRR